MHEYTHFFHGLIINFYNKRASASLRAFSISAASREKFSLSCIICSRAFVSSVIAVWISYKSVKLATFKLHSNDYSNQLQQGLHYSLWSFQHVWLTSSWARCCDATSLNAFNSCSRSVETLWNRDVEDCI